MSLPTINGEVLRPSIDALTDLRGHWSILPELMPARLQQAAIVTEVKAANVNPSYDLLSEGVAHIQVRGPMSKLGFGSDMRGSTLLARTQINAALNDPSIKGVLLSIESPGGSVNGTKELADAVANLSEAKPVIVFAQDILASAAYWVASQADWIIANDSGLVGSIGTYMVVYDFSKMLDEYGIKAHAITSGGFKGAGAMGTEITEDQIAEWQRVILSLNDLFVEGVASGRNVPKSTIEQLADGRVHIAGEARKIGLIDGVGTFAFALDTLSNLIDRRAEMSRTDLIQSSVPNTSSPGQSEGTTSPAPVQATAQPEGPKVATLTELQAIAGTDADFIVSQMSVNATVAAAQAAWTKKQADTIAELRAQLANGGQQTAAPTEPVQQAAPSQPAQATTPAWHGTAPLSNSGHEAGATGVQSLPEGKVEQKAMVDQKLAAIRQRDGVNFNVEAAFNEVAAEFPQLFKAQ